MTSLIVLTTLLVTTAAAPNLIVTPPPGYAARGGDPSLGWASPDGRTFFTVKLLSEEDVAGNAKLNDAAIGPAEPRKKWGVAGVHSERGPVAFGGVAAQQLVVVRRFPGAGMALLSFISAAGVKPKEMHAVARPVVRSLRRASGEGRIVVAAAKEKAGLTTVKLDHSIRVQYAARQWKKAGGDKTRVVLQHKSAAALVWVGVFEGDDDTLRAVLSRPGQALGTPGFQPTNAIKDVGGGALRVDFGQPEGLEGRMGGACNGGVCQALGVVWDPGERPFGLLAFGWMDEHVGVDEKAVARAAARAAKSDASAQAKQRSSPWFRRVAGLQWRDKSVTASGIQGAFVGGESETTLSLCPDGRFRLARTESVLGTGDSFAAGSESSTGGEGNWQLVAVGPKVFVSLAYRDGGQEDFFILSPLDAVGGAAALGGDLPMTKSERAAFDYALKVAGENTALISRQHDGMLSVFGPARCADAG